MKTLHPTVAICGLLLASFAGHPAWANVLNMGGTRNADGSWTGLASLETVPVGNPGNPADTRKWNPGVGAVPYEYRIGKYEVTAGQYTEFLNKVAGVDTYGLYSTNMWSSTYGCKIERYAGTGMSADPYRYRVASDWANRPVNYVNFWDACRFANWLHNGQPAGAQNGSTTEDGAYTLTPQGIAANSIERNGGWRWALPSLDEWFKAAYYNPATGTYYTYPTSGNSAPSNNLLNPDGGNNANYYQSDYTIGAPYYRTVVGEFELSASPYGTFDQGGNVFEWNNNGAGGPYRSEWGASFDAVKDSYMNALTAWVNNPTIKHYETGFRVALVPEPATLSLLALGGLLIARRRRA